jgi:hypothetical protein
MSYTDKIARRARGLEPGERLEAACKAMVADQIAATILFTAGTVAAGAAGGMAAARITERAPESDEPPAELAGAPQMILGLTDRRLLAWRMSGFLARPKEVLGSIDRARITGARLEETKIMGFRAGRLLIDLADTDRPLDLSVPRVQLAEAQALVAAIAQSK